MNVTMLVLNNFVGDARVHKEAKALAEAGHAVLVIALHRAGLPLEEAGHGYRVRRLALRSLRWKGGRVVPLLKYLEFIAAALSASRDHPARVVHAHDANTLLAASFLARRDRAALVYDAHELETGRNFGSSTLAGAYQRMWPLPERLFIGRARAVITVNQPIAAELSRLYRIEPPLVVLNAPEPAQPPRSDRLRQELGLGPEARLLLYQGRVGDSRGIETAIAALAHLGKDVHFAVLGSGPGLAEYRALAKRLGLAERVHFLGQIPLERLLEYTASADIGLSLIQNSCKSYYLSLPNKLLEYLMVGLPVIASDFPEMGRVVREFEVGELVQDPASAPELAQAVRRIFEQPARLEQMKQNTRRAAQKYNWEHEKRKLLALYERLEAGLAQPGREKQA